LRPAQHLKKLRPIRPNPLIATLIVTAYCPLLKFSKLLTEAYDTEKYAPNYRLFVMDFLKVSYRDPQARAQFSAVLQQTGFAVLTDHAIAPDLIFETYQEWGEFFNSPDKYLYKFDPKVQSGYFPFQTEQAKGYDQPDLKEFYHFYTWGGLPQGFSDRTENLFHLLSELAIELLGWLESPHESPPSLKGLQNTIAGSRETLLRILHYPPIIDAPVGAVRAAAHEDINLITLLPVAMGAGLEICDRVGNWQAVPCNAGDLIVNVGDMLQLASQGYYPSATHRVTNPVGEDALKSRYSMPLFLHPRPDVVLADGITARDYLQQRLREIGLL
jgi:isopenicillin N synthase-like dioxygenase